jgi:hypothetical protein
MDIRCLPTTLGIFLNKKKKKLEANEQRGLDGEG